MLKYRSLQRKLLIQRITSYHCAPWNKDHLIMPSGLIPDLKVPILFHTPNIVSKFKVSPETQGNLKFAILNPRDSGRVSVIVWLPSYDWGHTVVDYFAHARLLNLIIPTFNVAHGQSSRWLGGGVVVSHFYPLQVSGKGVAQQVIFTFWCLRLSFEAPSCFQDCCLPLPADYSPKIILNVQMLWSCGLSSEAPCLWPRRSSGNCISSAHVFFLGNLVGLVHSKALMACVSRPHFNVNYKK